MSASLSDAEVSGLHTKVFYVEKRMFYTEFECQSDVN